MNRLFEGENIPIIMMSAFFKNEFYALMNLCGIKKWLNKPFQPLDLISAVEETLVHRPAAPWFPTSTLTESQAFAEPEEHSMYLYNKGVEL
jgi:DNA-binding response OmpR family regulator